jgi:hypothetical protein
MASKLPLIRVRTVQWTVLLQLAMTAHRHWQRLDAAERRRLAELLKKSQGRPDRLTTKERTEIRELVAKLEPREFARSVVPLGRRAVTARRRS